MTFLDIFKSSFLEQYPDQLTNGAMVRCLVMAAALGLYIFLIYRLVTKKSFYSKSFNISLWVLTIITAAIILVISSNITLSLGMVGALSIVRYRTAIKDPMDLVFLFWAIAEGIICGAGLIVIGMMLALVISAGLLLLDKLPTERALKIMTVHASDPGCEDAVMAAICGSCKICRVKSRSLSAGQLNLVLEFSCKEEKQCTDALMAIPGVHSVSTLTHDGEVTF